MSAAAATPDEIAAKVADLLRAVMASGYIADKRGLLKAGEEANVRHVCLKVWATKRTIMESVADVPENWLDEFAANQPNDIRKFGDSQNSRLNYRVAAVLEAVEARRYFRSSNQSSSHRRASA